MAEIDQEAEIEQNRTMLASILEFRKRGQTIATAITFFCLAAAVGLFYTNRATAGGALLGLSIVMLVQSFLPNNRPQRDRSNVSDES